MPAAHARTMSAGQAAGTAKPEVQVNPRGIPAAPFVVGG